MSEADLLRIINSLEKRLQKLETSEEPRLKMLTTPLTSTSWDGDSYSTVGASTQIDLSTVFSAPAGIKAVLLEVGLRDSAAWGTADLYILIGPTSTYYYAMQARCYGGDVQSNYLELVPCDSNGDVWYQINASGVGTMDIVIRIWGYVI